MKRAKKESLHLRMNSVVKRLVVALLLSAALGIGLASCSEDAYYEEPVQPLPPEEITQPLPPNIEPH